MPGQSKQKSTPLKLLRWRPKLPPHRLQRNLLRWNPAVPAHLRARVILTGAQGDLGVRADYLASADVLAFTARVVSHPMALIEGMAAGLPAVAYDIEGVRELITDGHEGFKVAPGDRRALARRMLELLGDDRARRAMGRNARARVASFDWSVVGEQILTIYRKAIGKSEDRGQPREAIA